MRKVKYVDSLELVRKTVGPISKNLIYSRTVGQTKGEVQVRPLVATTSGCRPDQRTRDQSRVRTAHLHNPIANSITLLNGELYDATLRTDSQILRGFSQPNSDPQAGLKRDPFHPRLNVVCCRGSLASSSKPGLMLHDCTLRADSLRRTSVSFQDRSETRLPFRPRESSPLYFARPYWVSLHPRLRNDPETMAQ